MKKNLPSIALIMSLVTVSAGFSNLDGISDLRLKAARGDAAVNLELAKRLESGAGIQKNLGQAYFYYGHNIIFL